MFTGIVRGVGRIARIERVGGDRRMRFDVAGIAIGRCEIGASIAINGVCLTVVDIGDAEFAADVSGETLAVTTLGQLQPGAPVNVEPALRLGDSLDGHWVTGHVDGIGRIVAVEAAARSVMYGIELPGELERFVARKGSVAVDGVSLTVNTVDGPRFGVNIVPHTRERTIIGGYEVGTAVNIEVDIIARYLDRLAGNETGARGLDLEMLEKHGYTNGN